MMLYYSNNVILYEYTIIRLSLWALNEPFRHRPWVQIGWRAGTMRAAGERKPCGERRAGPKLLVMMVLMCTRRASPWERWWKTSGVPYTIINTLMALPLSRQSPKGGGGYRMLIQGGISPSTPILYVQNGYLCQK